MLENLPSFTFPTLIPGPLSLKLVGGGGGGKLGPKSSTKRHCQHQL